MRKILTAIVAGALLLCGALGQTETPVEGKATFEDLIGLLWNLELECPFPNFRMSREAFGISADKTYTFDEKVGLIYRARELRRGQRLCIKEEGLRHQARMNDSFIPLEQRKKMALGFTTAPYTQHFLDTEKGKRMVDYLNSKKVGVDDLLKAVMSHEAAVADRWHKSDLKRAGIDKPLEEMDRDEQIDSLYRVYLEKEKTRMEKRDAKAAPQTENVNGKPPVKPWRANPKSRTTRARPGR